MHGKDCDEESPETHPLVEEEEETVIIKKEEEDIVYHLEDHLLTYFQEEEPHRCGLCEEAFPTEQSLKVHLLRHTGGGPYACNICGRVFVLKHSLTVHERFHSEEKPYQCGSCEKRFRTASSRDHHQRYWHPSAGDRHVCPYCNFKAASSDLLLSHIQNLHTKDDESPLPSEVQKQVETQHSVQEGQETVNIEKEDEEDNNEHLTENLLTYFKERPHQCGLCEKAFTSKQNLKVHLLSHTGKRPYVCDTCGKGFAQRHTLTIHERIHLGEKPFPCGTCEKRFRTSSSRHQHQRYWHPSTEDCAACPYCDFKAVSSRFLLSHIRILHTKDRESASSSEVQQKQVETQHSEGKEAVDSVEKEEEEEDSNDHLFTPVKERRHHCKHCDKAFTSRQNLRTHIRSHTGERPYICETCGKGFTSKNYLTVHERYHSGERRHPCGTCGKRFFSTGDLYRHEVTHITNVSKIPNNSEELIQKCECCCKAFVRLEPDHSGPFICTTCEKGLNPKTNLKEPKRTHSGEESQMSDNNGLSAEHLLSLSGKQLYKCELCDKAFAQKGHLKIHFRNHTGERPYVCDTCGKGFTRKYYLTVHERFHSGERPYPCDACSKRYATSGDLQRHQKKVHTMVIKSEPPS